MLIVEEPGLLASIQDGGRPAAAVLGVPRGGACDPDGMAVANLLLGNRADAPVVEVTLGGTTLRVAETAVVGLAGADLGARVVDEDRPLPPGRAALVRAGSTIAFGGGRGGLRAYLALPGGIDVPPVLGSASACPVAQLPGLAGRALATADRLRARAAGDLSAAGRAWPEPPRLPDAVALLRVLAGPGREALRPAARATLLGVTWTIGEASDRVGVRLAGAPEARRRLQDEAAADSASMPMTWGAVQLPPSGEPIILGPDAGTLGGYLVPYVVATVDRGLTGQLRPGDAVRLVEVAARDARTALLEHERRRAAAVTALGSRGDWDAVADATG